MFTRCERWTRQKTFGIEAFVQVVERPVVRRPDVVAGNDGDGVFGQRGVDDVLGLHEDEALADLDRQPLAAVLAFGDEIEDLLELLVDRPAIPLIERPGRRHAALSPLDRPFEPHRIDRLQAGSRPR